MYAKIVRPDLLKLAPSKTHQNMRSSRTIIDCPNERVKAPPTVYERTFYNESQAWSLAISWLEKTGKLLGIHIHHAMCGHGGERWILGAPVDGYASNREQSSNIMGAGGMDVVDVLPTGTQKSLTVKREKNYSKPQRPEQKP